MRRRDLLALAAAPPPECIVLPECPVDEKRMNEFAFEWNQYVLKLQNSIVDLEQWKQVKRALIRLK